jgi:hypothetical protein
LTARAAKPRDARTATGQSARSSGSLLPIARALLVCALAGAASGCGPLRVWQGADTTGRRRVELLEAGGHQYLRIDGVDGRRYDAVAVDALTFAPGAGRIAYPAARGERWVVVIDGRESAAYDGIGEVVFSADGAHLAFSAELAGRWRVVRDGVAGAPWDALIRRSLGFGDDGRLSFAGWQGEVARLSVEGQLSPPFDSITDVVRAPGSGRIALLATRGSRCAAVLDKTEEADLPAFKLERCEGLRVSPDGAHFAFVGARDGCAHLLVDGNEDPGSCGVDAASVAFSSDGAHLAYVRRDGAGAWLVHDGEASGPYDDVAPPVFAPRGARWGYLARRDGESVVIVDGAARATHSRASDLALSAEGTHVAYFAFDGARATVVHDGRAVASDVVLSGTLVLSADGRHWACVMGDASTERLHVSIDGHFARAFALEELAARMVQSSDPAALTAAVREGLRAELEHHVAAHSARSVSATPGGSRDRARTDTERRSPAPAGTPR